MFEQTIHRRTFLAACGTLACPTLMTGAQEPTVSNTGETSKEWQPLDELLTNFVREQQPPGAAVAVAHQSKIVYARGFGWADKDRQRPVQPDSLFRIASISKPVTAVAVLQLVEQGRVKLEDRFLDVVPFQPFVATGQSIDERVKSITIRQLLQHTAGWDREKSFDPIGRPWEISAALGMEGAPSPTDVMRYGLGLKLDFDPGARYAYANVDYLCLGRLIEHCTGLPYVEAVQQRVLQPLGITRMNLGRAQESELAADEVRYYDRRNRRGKCLYPPHIGEEVPSVYGAENLQGYEAHGGWIASAVDLARFSAAFADPQRCPLLKPETIATMWSRPEGEPGWEADGVPKPVYYGCGWSVRPVDGGGVNAWHTGRITGTSTLMVRRHDGLSWAVLFNTDAAPLPSDEPLSKLIDPLLHAAVNACRERGAFDE